MTRLSASLAVAALGTVVLWLALSLNTVIVIGHEFGYLRDGRFPFYPTIPVTYVTLSLLAIPFSTPSSGKYCVSLANYPSLYT